MAQDNFRIPVVDFSKYRSTTDPLEKGKAAEEIVGAFKESGFVYLSNHGIPEKTITDIFERSAQFFLLPLDVKEQLAWKDPRANRGWMAVGREKASQSLDRDEVAAIREKTPDYKETMEIGCEWDRTWQNQWPQEQDLPGFKPAMLGFFQTCHDLHVLIMRSIALGLGLEETFFDDRINQQCHNLRLLSYPPMKRVLLQEHGHARTGAHTDYGSITLLFQDSVGGLEVQNPQTGEFQPAVPIPGTVVVNAADLLARWSNDVLRSTMHRVVAPPGATAETTPARQSIAFFCNPNFDAVISCLPNCYGPDKEKKYPSVTTEDYIVQRLAATVY